MSRWLLKIESGLTIPLFIVSWWICAVVFACKAGYLMAKADGAGKKTLLESMFKAKS